MLVLVLVPHCPPCSLVSYASAPGQAVQQPSRGSPYLSRTLHPAESVDAAHQIAAVDVSLDAAAEVFPDVVVLFLDPDFGSC